MTANDAHTCAPETDPMVGEIDALADRLMDRAVCIASGIPVDVRCDIVLAILCLRTLSRSVPVDALAGVPRLTSPAKITACDAAHLADRLTGQQATCIEREMAGRLIQVLLRQCHSSDFWTLPPSEG